MTYEIRQIDSWYDGETWTYNETFHIGTYTTRGNDGKRAFLRALHKYGIYCIRGKCRVDYDGNIYELQDRKTEEPLLYAYPVNS